MKFYSTYNKATTILFIAIFGFFMSSCRNDEPDEPDATEVSNSILLYAVASNNLYSSFLEDMKEIEEGLAGVDFSKVDFIIYSVTPYQNGMLKRAVKDSEGNISFKPLKEYDKSLYSTDPKRISQIISDYCEFSKADDRGLILWSHGTAWQPNFSDHITPTLNYSFGADNILGKTDYCDIDELAVAIPDGVFNYIWFDCCYMASIETYYQLRNKADYFVGSPMELAAEGNPYHLVLPFLARSDYSLINAAEAESRYFINRRIPIALSIVNTSYLEDVADLAEKAVTGTRPSKLRLQTYNRPPVTYLCDFSQYTLAQGSSLGDEWDADAFNSLMGKMVIYKSVSDKDWRNQTIDQNNYSGLSVYYFEDLDSDESNYYMTLDWFDRVYTTVPVF